MSIIMNQLNDQDAFFNVAESQIFTANGDVIPNKKAILNAATGRPISVVSTGYRTITNQEVFESFDRSLMASGLDLDGATANVQFSHNRARTMVTVTVPAIKVTVAGDETQAQIVALNSYDGKWKYSVRAGGIRLACLNGQVIGTIVSQFAHFHTKHIDINSSADKMIRMMNEFSHSQSWFEKMIGTKITDDTAQQWIVRFLKGHDITDPQIIETVIAGRVGGELHGLWLKYRTEMGSTAYALYNVFTDYVTHKNYRTNRAAGVLNGNKKIAQLITPRSVFALPQH